MTRRPMLSRERTTRKIQSDRTRHHIEYADDRVVRLILVDAPATVETDSEGRRIVTAKGKRYVVGTIRQDGVRPYVHYWSERNGKTFGATRSTTGDAKPGTVGRAIWSAVTAG
ncbi:hypothetical protein [Streptomyces sp. NPDC087300]|uniref:hypothetical protein n=1 Tax=Streptomyces sp. NPDC087300 TaxID=3365780 RepID=UPI003817CE3D